MSTTKDEIRQWFKKGVEQKATHMIVLCDTFSHEDYPVYVEPGQDVHKVEESYHKKNERVMEVYNLSLDMEAQMNQLRAFNY